MKLFTPRTPWIVRYHGTLYIMNYHVVLQGAHLSAHEVSEGPQLHYESYQKDGAHSFSLYLMSTTTEDGNALLPLEKPVIRKIWYPELT